MTERWIFIEPNDVLMFRDSRPFAAGQNFVARSMFPPHPRTMQGVIRSHILEAQQADLRAYALGRGTPELMGVLGHPDGWGTLRLDGPFVAHKQAEGAITRYFRAPLDVLASKSTPVTLHVLSPSSDAVLQTNAPFDGWRPLLARNIEGAGQEADGWLTEGDFIRYLRGQAPAELMDSQTLFQTEARVGLGIDHSRRRHAPGLFYHAEFIRPQPGVGLLVGISGDQGLLPKGGPICIGGEGRGASYSILPGNKFGSLHTATSGQLKVVLLTPAYFSEGWLPAGRDWSPWVGTQARLVSVAVGRPQIISGWNMAAGGGRGASRPIRHFVPTGSVFFFENAHWQGRPFTEETEEDGSSLGTMGFGSAALGAWS